MANKKKDVYRPKPMTEGKKAVIQGLLDEYDIQSAEDIQDALKDLLSGTIQTMLETEMNEHLGYEKYARDVEPNYRNGTKPKTVRSKYGEFEVDVPQDRNSTFETVVLLSKGEIPSKKVKVEFSLEGMDTDGFKDGATYDEIRDWVQEKYGIHVTNLNIAQIKRKNGIIERENYNKPKSEDSRQTGTTPEKEKAITEALKHFNMI
ncbi:Transposase, Mutator family [Butyrivibrio sp. ob235]|uniref:transposase n=1 Tax=Butyrivibrio sp. ob235 TaxID=1761780 RepID=UPI0008D57C85|nr:transposase [Butyrivibrio sp. ob235]SEL12929.1 Transposase, Mutator family [Butyrivibrio sp. ob235]